MRVSAFRRPEGPDAPHGRGEGKGREGVTRVSVASRDRYPSFILGRPVTGEVSGQGSTSGEGREGCPPGTGREGSLGGRDGGCPRRYQDSREGAFRR